VDLEYGVNVWVRSLTILNADNGIKMRGIDRSTISGEARSSGVVGAGAGNNS
jgi:hypothetical protein